ncbi:MAG: glycine cleavage system aminomethyltransferase GcvT [Candidatus Limnocylindria bacterium]
MTAQTLQRSPLHDEHVALGAKMVPFAGYEMPIQYAGIIAEHRATRASAGLFDLSHMGEFHVRGPDSGSALDRLVSSDIAGLHQGQARYGLLCNEGGTIVDDVIVYRLGADEYLVVVNASNIPKDRAHVETRLGEGARLEDASAETALIAVQGPRSPVVLSAVTDLPVREDSIESLPSFGVAEARVGGVRATVARTGYTGEDGFEVFVPAERAAQVWSRLLAAGESTGIVPVGLGARDTLRLEARFSLYGNEIDATTSPIEAGLGWTCKLDKDFVGRDAIVAAKAAGPTRKLVGLVLDGGVARHGHEVVDEIGGPIGRVTSGTYGPTVQRNIALAYVPVERSKIGTSLAVRIRERDVPARVVKVPFYSRITK